MSYYQKNKQHWRKGGKYYNYEPMRFFTKPITIKRGKFIIYWD